MSIFIFTLGHNKWKKTFTFQEEDVHLSGRRRSPFRKKTFTIEEEDVHLSGRRCSPFRKKTFTLTRKNPLIIKAFLHPVIKKIIKRIIKKNNQVYNQAINHGTSELAQARPYAIRCRRWRRLKSRLWRHKDIERDSDTFA